MDSRYGQSDRLDYNDSSDSIPNAQYRKSPPRDYSRRNREYRDRDREDYRSPRHDSRSRSRSPSRRERARSPWYGGPPNREVIMEGLPMDITENDIRSELEQYYQVEGLADIRVIRDRKTGTSRQFGFLQFHDSQASTAFLDKNHPEIKLHGNAESTTKVTIAFSRQRDDRDRERRAPEPDWLCSNCDTTNYARRQECFKCSASRAYYSAGPPPVLPQLNTGDSDVSLDGTPSQFLLLRGLETSVTEELLSKGVAKLYKVSEADANKKAGAKVSSTTATSNFGAQEGSLKRVFVVRDRLSDDSWRYGFAEFHSVEDAQAALTKFDAIDKFTIASKPVLATYIHAGVFVPYIPVSPEDIKFSFAATTNPLLRLAYWEPKAYVREFVVSDTPPNFKTNTTTSSTTNNLDPAGMEGIIKNSKDADGKSKKRKADIATTGANKKVVAPHLEFWKNRHAELHGEGGKKFDDNASTTTDMSDKPAKEAEEDSLAPPSQSYANPKKMCCYLCSRQFKTEAEVNKHERLSQLHRDNMNNAELVAKATAKMKKAGITSVASEPAATDTLEYRDRAKERRAVHGQPKKARPNPAKTSKSSPEPEEAKQKAPSKGASLLGKMGWTSGQGLGAQGTGMTAPIATDIYAQGVGLGASGSKLGDAVEEADRRTKGGYESFMEKTKETARDRWEQMSKDKDA
ncbi:hypothetical protein BT63DRAFT_381570 [Microthyrium microscopicum]|uniref:RNA-binding domain-containing protein n=1 Tax=Microthyrium microscopicum TaxID=703497 RepID=A0A6A6UV92_9PEZI|nr:hypothetical protein BT63DRAFT_381570 [Microthyrium microscopicum]